MGNLEHLLTHAQATKIALELPRIMSRMGLPWPDAHQLQSLRAELLKPQKRLMLPLESLRQTIYLHIFGQVVGFSLELRNVHNQRLAELSDRLELAVDDLVLTGPFDDEDWGEYLAGVLDAWWFIHSKIWDAHAVVSATERSIMAMASELDTKQPTANLANHEARNVVFGLYDEVARQRSRMGALQIAQLTTKVMGHLYEIPVPNSVDVKATIAKFVA